jgi:hypothetical protein
VIPRPPPGYAAHASVVSVCCFVAFIGLLLLMGAGWSGSGIARGAGGAALIGGSGFALVRWWRAI